jgi:hypothetical protein
MSTKGLVVVTQERTVVLKIHAFCNGYQADKLEENLQKFGKVPSPKEAWKIAVESGFGGKDGMTVVVYENGYYSDKGLHDVDWIFQELKHAFGNANCIPPLEYQFMAVTRFKN